ncbi:hypothetical protein GOBAR_DD00533 [Gossypium barbadense]|nr:hypothetical protein GOBAR_DD00533 [Gossypium barbadense]
MEAARVDKMFFRDKILNQSGQSKPLGESLVKDIELMEGDVTDNNGGIPSSNFSNQVSFKTSLLADDMIKSW